MIMPQSIKPMGLVHVPGTGPNNRFDFKNKGNNRVNEAKDRLTLEKLPYKISDLEPVLSKINVDYHYNVLSAGYVNRYNNNEGDSEFNYGGAMLHNLFWAQLQKPKTGNNPSGTVKELIDKKFKDYKKFKEEMLGKAMSIQGSGWVYLSKSGELKTTPNQSYKTDILMPIDMWEHSFSDYVPAKDAKKRYIENIMKIINWEVINHRMSTLNEEAAGVGLITKQNTTPDVKPGETTRQANKLGLGLTKKGVPAKSMRENFADGKVKGKSRPGRVKRAGASCKGSVTSLRSKAKNSSGEKAKMYHWCANMKSGRKKSR
jgi:superoxide dismutase